MKTIFFVGQAPPLKHAEIPYVRTRLYQWLEAAGITKTDARFRFGALVGEFPGTRGGSHKPPTPSQIRDHLPLLRDSLASENPDVIVLLGKMAMREITGDEQAQLDNFVGADLALNPFECLRGPVPTIVLPHPSGANPWIYTGTNMSKLNIALNRLHWLLAN